jgi:hypothetical protein
MLPVLPVVRRPFHIQNSEFSIQHLAFINNAQKTRYTRYIVDGQRLNPLQMPLQGRHRPATCQKLFAISSLEKSNP